MDSAVRSMQYGLHLLTLDALLKTGAPLFFLYCVMHRFDLVSFDLLNAFI